MINLFKILILILFTFALTKPTFASQNSFVSVVNPVRGSDFWDLKDQKVETAVLGESEILKKYNVSATWLIRYDALLDESIISKIKNLSDEKGLFLEVTPSWTKDAGVDYHKGETWHSAGSAFLTGYEPDVREKLIDSVFEKFKSIFGSFPKSVGAWWVDAHSLSYMQIKYGITASLIVADQYTTDNYQIWGQYFSTPYYPSKNNALHPAQNLDSKIPVVIQQWAPRDPVNSYGNGVGESTYSVQANDYIDYHNLDTNYFSKLVDIYTKQPLNKFSQIVVGLENSYDWKKYSKEYENQIKSLVDKRNAGQISIVTMADFAEWYKASFSQLSPEQIIIADDPLGTFRKVVWFMNPYYRVGWFLNQDGSVFRDIRQYIDGEEELCLKARCDSVNFATSASRVLDEVSFGHKWIIDEGKIKDFKVNRISDRYVLNYINDAGNAREIEFLPRDISIDGKISSIDKTILDATKKDLEKKQIQEKLNYGKLKISALTIFKNIIIFALFLTVACLIPGFNLISKHTKDAPFFKKIFLSNVVGFVELTLFFYIVSLINLRPLIFLYLFINLYIFFQFKLFLQIFRNLPMVKNRFSLVLTMLIISGTVFQVLPVFQSGINFNYGIGLWGPNTHDGIWHISLINQLAQSVPPQNPIFAGVVLKNYHYFYDLLIAAVNYLTNLSILDLVFRFFPIIFSASLGIGSYFLIWNLFKENIGVLKTKVAVLIALYLVYFAGSFGWIVEFITQRHLGGESAFWANQAVSFNLNPPFAASLIIIIALLQLLPFKGKLTKSGFFVNIILIGSLIAFKSYAGVLVILSILIIGLIDVFKIKNFSFIMLFIFGGIISAFLFLFNFEASNSLLIVAPFWFVHSMIDSPDRVGWTRLALTRIVGLNDKNWIKFFGAEALSLLIFIIGNLGVRFFALFALVKFKEILKNRNFLFLMVLSLLSTLIPLVFIQAGNPWNTIQFFYYGMYVSSIGAGVVISYLIFKLPRIIGLLIIVLVIFIGPINSVVTAKGYLVNKPHAFVSAQELEGLDFLSKQEEGNILTYPYNQNLKKDIAEPWPLFVYDSTAYVSAFSKKAVYLEDFSQNNILLTDYKKRQVASNDFFMGPDSQKQEFLRKNNIKYIYIPKIFNQRIDESSGIKNIFENEEIIIYGVNE
ncbi:MAG: hypothetical protein Q7R43_03395 [Candidatus Daviesbacteria bacterium]|nr:hypothetical protein [Candidatus Daviesbacteria bacterium]